MPSGTVRVRWEQTDHAVREREREREIDWKEERDKTRLAVSLQLWLLFRITSWAVDFSLT